MPFDRIVQLDFAPELGAPPHLHIMCEVQGRYSNAILADGAKTVLLAARQIGGGQSSARAVRVGAAYPLPPPPPGAEPTADMPFESWQAAVDAWCAKEASGDRCAVQSALAGAFRGVSPAIARQLCAESDVSTGTLWQQVATGDRQRLHQATARWVARVSTGDFAPARDVATGAVSVLGAYSEVCENVCAAVDVRYQAAQARERFDRLRASLTHASQAAEKGIRGRMAAFQKQLDGAEAAEETQKQGDMIMANVHRWPQGKLELDAEDWDTGDQIPCSRCVTPI